MNFKAEELAQYPLLSKIEVGQSVIALPESDYKGISGVITEILYGESRETENETILDIVVDFDTDLPLEDTHPHLNGTGIGNVFMGEDELAFAFDHYNQYVSAKGQLYCKECEELKLRVNKHHAKSESWTWGENGQEYGNEQSSSYMSFDDCGHEVYDVEGYLKKPEVLEVTYVSVWDGGFEIKTKAKFDPVKSLVFDIESTEGVDGNGDEVEQLVEEYILLPDGTKYFVEEENGKYVAY